MSHASNDKSKMKKTKKVKPESVRLMIPFSMKCLKCNEYIAQSRKFNARKETTQKDYLGIKIIRFNLRCPRCYGEIIFETDPKNSDFQCISGCKKNYERVKDIKTNETIDEMILRIENEVKEDEQIKELEKKGKQKKNIDEETGMEQLEKRLVEQQKEKERVEKLEELHEHMKNLENKRDIINNINKYDKNNEDYLDLEVQKAFSDHRHEKIINENKGLMNAYSDDSDQELNKNDLYNMTNEENKCNIKRPTESVKGITKRKKQKIII